MLLPDTLEIPVVLASALQFEGDLTARDRALLFSVSWLAGRTGSDDLDELRIPDLGLRRALGDMRRPDKIFEVARYLRIGRARIQSDMLPDLSSGVEAPIVREGMRRRLIRGAYEWVLDPAIATNFATYIGDEVVGVPRALFAGARCRYTLTLMLRALAWGCGDYNAKWLRRKDDEKIVLRVPLMDMKREIGADPAIKPADLLRYDLEPAVQEIITLTDTVVDVKPVKAPSLRAGGGRVIAVDVLVGRVERKIAAEGRTEGSDEGEGEVPADNVVAFPGTGSKFAGL